MSGRIGLPDVQRDEDDPAFFAPFGRCLICNRPLDIASDPDSLNCGGDCRGCIREIEDEDFHDDGTYRGGLEMRVSAFYAEAEPVMEEFETFAVAARYARPAEEEGAGTSPAKETGHKPPSVSPAPSLSAVDPNADLTGLVIPNVGIVGETPAWSDGMYVRVGETVRLAALVRRLKQDDRSTTIGGTKGGNE